MELANAKFNNFINNSTVLDVGCAQGKFGWCLNPIYQMGCD